MKHKNKVYIKHWLALKPRKYSGKTDLYYLKIANEIRESFIPSTNFMLSELLDEEDISLFCCFLTCYFEDIISQTNIWATFKSLHQANYGKTLPFYVIQEDYIDDEINFEDIAFLTWYFLNTFQQERFISPYNDFILDIATCTMNILESEYEYAPENKTLQDLYSFKSDNDDFYMSRIFMQHVFLDSYLFFPDIKLDYNDEISNLINQNEEDDPSFFMGYIREITEDFTFNKVSSLLALKAKDWTAELLGESHPHYNDIITISNKIFGYFLYKSQDKDVVNLEHIASGMSFKMTKKSFDHYIDLKEGDILTIGLVKWQNEWWFSGNFFKSEFNADLILDQKNSVEARSKVSFLEDPKELSNILKKQEKAFLKFNRGSLIAYMNSNEISSFISGFYDFYRDSLKLTNKEQEEAIQRTKDDGFLGETNNFEDFSFQDKEAAIVFFNPKSGPEMYFDIINAFPDKNNPFYTEESKDDIMHILISPEYSTEFTYYFINNYKDKLSFFKQEPFISYLDDIDFLLRFWKKDSYHTKSSLVLTGKQEKLST